MSPTCGTSLGTFYSGDVQVGNDNGRYYMAVAEVEPARRGVLLLPGCSMMPRTSASAGISQNENHRLHPHDQPPSRQRQRRTTRAPTGAAREPDAYQPRDSQWTLSGCRGEPGP
jgi:hypothetical protein